MTDPANHLTDPARLDELAAVTKEYAQFSGPNAGIALALLGCWLLGSERVRSSSAQTGTILFLLAPFAWVVLAWSARAYYQRHGEVIGSSRADRSVRSAPMVAASLFVVFVAALRGIVQLFEGPRGGHETFAIAAYLAMAMLAVALVRTAPWIAYTYWGVATFASLTGERYAWARIAFGATATAAGILGHIRYRRLERRLAVLKGRAP